MGSRIRIMLGKLIWLIFVVVEVRGQEVCNTPECRLAAESILSSLDVTAEPCSDFYQFACGGWMAKNNIPEGKSKWGRFYELRDKVDQALHEIVEMESGESEAEAVKNLRRMYAGCMDTAAIEAVGLGALIDKLADPVDGWPMVLDSWNDESYDLESALGGARREFGVNWLLSTSVYLDDLNTNQNVIYVDQPDLGLPLSMYLDEASYTDYIAAYKQFIVDIALVVVRESGSSIPASTGTNTSTPCSKTPGSLWTTPNGLLWFSPTTWQTLSKLKPPEKPLSTTCSPGS